MRKQPVQRKPEGTFSKRRILSNAEQSFFKILKDSLPEYEIFSKIRLIDVIRNHVYKDGNRIIQKHVDFVVTDRSFLVAVAAIELDDSTHGSEENKCHDDVKDFYLGAAGVPIIRFSTKEIGRLSPIELKERILTAKVLTIPYPSSSGDEDAETENDSSTRKRGCASAAVFCALILASAAIFLYHFI